MRAKLLGPFSRQLRSLSSAQLIQCPVIAARRNGTVLPCIKRRRMCAMPPPHLNSSSLSMEQYHRLSEQAMDHLLECLEIVVDSTGCEDYEVEYSSGVMTLKLGDKGTYVINKQPPNKQIWLSSPFSGPKRYDYNPEQNAWYYTRDGQQLDELLSEELSVALERDVKIRLEQTREMETK